MLCYDDGDGEDEAGLKNDINFTFECKSAQYAYRSKNLPRLNMQPQRSIPKEDTKN